MQIKELTARNTEDEIVVPVKRKLDDLKIKSYEFRDPFSIVTSLTCYHEKMNGLNHLLVFVGAQDAATYLSIREFYVELNHFETLSQYITDDFLEFDAYVETLFGKCSKLSKVSDISYFISNGFRFINNDFEHVYLVYIEAIGVFKFEKGELPELKKFISEHRHYFR